MIKEIKNILKISGILFLGSFMLWNCESEADNLGSQFFQTGTAQGEQTAYPIIAYNVSNNDTIKADRSRLGSATLGAFSEPVFGLQKSSYFTQVRLATYNPDFGTNPVVDSVVLSIKPYYAADSLTTTTLDKYSYVEGTNTIESKKVVNTYPIIKYGNTKKSMKLNVFEVDEFMGSVSDNIYSNKSFAASNLLGSKILNGTVNSIKITKNSDNTELFNRDVAIRIPLDASFFQNKIIAKKGSAELADAASFVRYFKGIKIMAEENDGYLFSFIPSNVTMQMYYKSDVTANNVTTRTSQVYVFSVSDSYNVFSNNITNTPVSGITNTPNYNGDNKIYAQGMGGPGFGLKIPDATIQTIKDLYNKNKIGIISAKIRLFTDNGIWNNNYAKPTSFIVRQKDIANADNDKTLFKYLSDITALTYTNYKLVTPYNLNQNPAYYDISITKTLKDIIETNAKNYDFKVDVGSYTYTANGVLTGLTYGSDYSLSQYFNTRSYTPNRVVLIGTDPSKPVGTDITSAKSAQLIITYGQK